ncbi:hypothetical protein CEK25_010288 [Fusarium fujikuroi]|nr:hypothetical protein CEK25_010288 [Fusarium fujikuroi]
MPYLFRPHTVQDAQRAIDECRACLFRLHVLGGTAYYRDGRVMQPRYFGGTAANRKGYLRLKDTLALPTEKFTSRLQSHSANFDMSCIRESQSWIKLGKFDLQSSWRYQGLPCRGSISCTLCNVTGEGQCRRLTSSTLFTDVTRSAKPTVRQYQDEERFRGPDQYSGKNSEEPRIDGMKSK